MGTRGKTQKLVLADLRVGDLLISRTTGQLVEVLELDFATRNPILHYKTLTSFTGRGSSMATTIREVRRIVNAYQWLSRMRRAMASDMPQPLPCAQ